MSEDPVFQPTRENWLENQYRGKLYHVHVLCWTGVGSKSLLDHRSSPIGAVPSLERGERRKSTNASFEAKGAVIRCLLGISNLPMVGWLLAGLAGPTLLRKGRLVVVGVCIDGPWLHMPIDPPLSASSQFTQATQMVSRGSQAVSGKSVGAFPADVACCHEQARHADALFGSPKMR